MKPIKSSRIEAFIGDGDYPLELRIGELRLLQSALDSGPSAILDRFSAANWLVDDVIEPIRLGLIGGGMSHRDAKTLTDAYVVPGYLVDYLSVAFRVISAALVGDQDDPPEDSGEPEAPTMTTPES